MDHRFFIIERQYHENGSTLKNTANLKEDLLTGFKSIFSIFYSLIFAFINSNLNHLIAIPLSQEENDFLAELGTTHLGWSNGVEGAQAQRFFLTFFQKIK